MLSLMDGMEDIPVAAMGETYGSLRIVNPRADEAMLTSIKRYGQLTPVVCAKRDSYELIDGFKRLRACRRIGKETLKAKILVASERVLKAAIIQLNRLRPIRELEEAMVLSSLHREDGLTADGDRGIVGQAQELGEPEDSPDRKALRGSAR
jgi:ParB-like chromosome segregation protein Spo0J